MRRYLAAFVLAGLLAGCGGGSTTNSSRPVPAPTISAAPTVQNFVFAANSGSASLSEFGVADTASGVLSGANSISVTDNGVSVNPLGEALDAGFTAPPGSEAPDRLGVMVVADAHGLLTFSYTAAAGALQANQTTSVPPASGGTLTGPLAIDPGLNFVFAATTSGVEAYQLTGATVSQMAVSNAVTQAGVTSLAATLVNGNAVLLATSPVGLTVFPIGGLNSSPVLGSPLIQATVAVPQRVAAASSSNSSVLVAVGETTSGSVNGETFVLSDVNGAPSLASETTFAVGNDVGCTAVAVSGNNVYAANANGLVAAFAGGQSGTAATAQLSSGVTSLFLLSPALSSAATVLYASTVDAQVVPMTVSSSALSVQAASASGVAPTAVQGSSTVVFAL